MPKIKKFTEEEAAAYLKRMEETYPDFREYEEDYSEPDIEMKWSEFQEAVFYETKHNESNLSVQAVAGSGKSTTLFEIAKRCTGNVLFLAFNKDIKEYAAMKMGSTAECKTFHGFGLYLLNAELGWYPNLDFKKLGMSKTWAAVSSRYPFVRGEWSPRRVLNRSLKKMRGVGFMSYDLEDIHDFLIENDECFSYNHKKKAREEAWVYANLHEVEYFLRLLDKLPVKSRRDRDITYRNVIDFDDMVRLPCIHDLATKKPLYMHTILVDEAQDMNPYQIYVIDAIYKRGVRVICVGDSNQAIYAFRGAYADSMERLAKMTDAYKLPLSVTYRCKSAIVNFVNDVIETSNMIPFEEGGEVFTDLQKENFVEVVKEYDVPMIIGAKNRNLIEVWITLAKNKIASTLKGNGITDKIKNILSDFNVIPGKNEEEPKVSILEMRVLISEAISEGLQENEEGVLRQTLPSNTLDLFNCILELIDFYRIEDYVEILDLLLEMDKDSDHHLHTVHSSKGLEAHTVIVLCDWFNSDQTDHMKYVAYTRASDRLFLVDGWEKDENID